MTTLVTGRISDIETAKSFLDAGFDGVVFGSTLVGNPKADEFIAAVKNLEMSDDAKIMSNF